MSEQSKNPKIRDLTHQQDFVRSNIKQSIIDESKDYFEYTSEKDEKYNFLNVKNFLFSKQMIKAFGWSLTIGSAFFLHRLHRTGNKWNALRWMTTSMFGSFCFVWGSFEFHPFMTAYIQSKQLEKRRIESMHKANHEAYLKRLQQTLGKYSHSGKKNETAQEKGPQAVINSDFYARHFLQTEANLLSKSCIDFDLKSIIRVIFKVNPFEDEKALDSVDLSEDFDVEEEEFYLSELNQADLKKYVIKALWIDYTKVLESGFLEQPVSMLDINQYLSADKLSKYADKSEDELSSSDFDQKQLYENRTLALDEATQIDNQFIESALMFLHQSQSIAEAVLKNAESQFAQSKNYLV